MSQKSFLKVMAHNNPHRSLGIITDTSPDGLCAVLTQYTPDRPKESRQVIVHARKPLTDIERRYSQIEREALGIKWACEKFDMYVDGTHLTVITDHQPLVSMLFNKYAKLPNWIDKWQLKLQQYDMTVKYKPRANNPADYSLRHPVSDLPEQEGDTSDQVFYFTTNVGLPKVDDLRWS